MIKSNYDLVMSAGPLKDQNSSVSSSNPSTISRLFFYMWLQRLSTQTDTSTTSPRRQIRPWALHADKRVHGLFTQTNTSTTSSRRQTRPWALHADKYVHGLFTQTNTSMAPSRRQTRPWHLHVDKHIQCLFN